MNLPTTLSVGKLDWPRSRGWLDYYPVRANMQATSLKQEWWCVLHIDEGLNRYMRWMLDKHVLNLLGEPGYGVQKPRHPAHISVIRGHGDVSWADRPAGILSDPDVINEQWGKLQGEYVDFQYGLTPERSPKPKGGMYHWYLPVHAPALAKIRKDMGLPYDWHLHLTIGWSPVERLPDYL